MDDPKQILNKNEINNIKDIANWTPLEHLYFTQLLFLDTKFQDITLYPPNPDISTGLKTSLKKDIKPIFNKVIDMRSKMGLNKIKTISCNMYQYHYNIKKYKMIQTYISYIDNPPDLFKIGTSVNIQDMDEKYIGTLLGFDNCAGQINGNYEIQIYLASEGVSVKNFYCNDKNVIISIFNKLKICVKDMIKNKYVKYYLDTIEGQFILLIRDLKKRKEHIININI